MEMKVGAEPRWDLDLAYGKQGELQVGDFLNWLARGNGRIEVKRKRRLDFELFIETECDKGRGGIYQPSGIYVTRADAWAFVIGDTGVTLIIPTALLKRAIQQKTARPKQETSGSCPTKGYLVNLAAVLALPSGNGAR